MKGDLKGSDDNRKILSILSHGAILLGFTLLAIAIPIVILFSSEDSVVKANAKESLNFFINAYVLATILAILMFVVIGFPLLILLAVATWVMPIIAMIKIAENPSRSYRYPLILHLL